MALSKSYVQNQSAVPQVFQKIQDGQAPPKFTIQYLKDLGFRSSTHRPFIPLLKALGFLTSDGTPTARYHEYRNKADARRVMGDALREAYGDLFLLKERPSSQDRAIIEGKFKSTHNASDQVAGLMANTFLSLLDLAELPLSGGNGALPQDVGGRADLVNPPPPIPDLEGEPRRPAPALMYNIQIQLPATKDIEVYNAIFRSVREYLLGD